MIKISGFEMSIVKGILKTYVPGCEVRVFGSRVSGRPKPYSDLDLVLMAESKINRETLIKLKEAFQESSLPSRVDVLDWHRISLEFQKIIEKGYQVIHRRVHNSKF